MFKADSDWSFQEDAIDRVVGDFEKEPSSRNLLVIPTGGGKTLTAIRIMNKLLENGFLSKEKLAIWATHRRQLRKQTKDALSNKESKKKFNFHESLYNILKVEMKDSARKILRNDKNGKYRLLIIDEAHHSAANTYKEFFHKKIGILGLTATPTRNDDSELEFDKISFTITFKELVKRNVLVKPKFHVVQTGKSIYATSLKENKNDFELEKFNKEDRNQFIADEIFKRGKFFKKVLVFVGTNKHVEDLYEVLRKKNKFSGETCKHIGYIYGGDNNDLDAKNDEYLKWHKKQKSSILVNCKLLNEGYDDPSIDTVVMAVPTKSILYYMQCLGRVVRNPGQSSENSANVLELEDDLPNVNYRIDNRWLFADISDFLEPIVIDEKCLDLKSFKVKVKSILKEHNVSKKYLSKIPSNEDFDDDSILLFSPSGKIKEDSIWYPIFITPENRLHYVQIFNQLSNNIESYRKTNDKYLLFEKLKVPRDDEYFGDRRFRVDLFATLKRALDEIKDKQKVGRLKYITFEKIEDFPKGFLEFIEDCHNKSYLKAEFSNKVENEMLYLFKFPLILGGYEGFYADEKVFQFYNNFTAIVKDIKENERVEDHDKILFENIGLLKNIPLPFKYLKSMIHIVREGIPDKRVIFYLGSDSDG